MSKFIRCTCVFLPNILTVGKGGNPRCCQGSLFNMRLFTALGLVLAEHLHIRMARLCYDTHPVEAMTFPGEMPAKTPCAWSYDFYQEKLPYKPPLGWCMRNIFSL